MSLWTPGGEHEVPDDRPGGAQPAGFDPDDLDDEQRAQLEAMAEEMAQGRAARSMNSPPKLSFGGDYTWT